MFLNLKTICVPLNIILISIFAAEIPEDFIDNNTSVQKQVTTTKNEIELLAQADFRENIEKIASGYYKGYLMNLITQEHFMDLLKKNGENLTVEAAINVIEKIPETKNKITTLKPQFWIRREYFQELEGSFS